ncbi:DUF1441 family protein [Vibrio cholerae]|uniref:DUF1441 family protein n=1 Tax=Vibrio cholerae TaxID=666 RepID=UPI001C92E277|nr:DUF1441 family protein [Vibrio cholerae]MBY4642229.1 DUF1441 family protein [Vibrio cholerae]MCR9658501.1 DUF1441 family protein [Vibrio cholerae]MCR9689182.1 DUF1441 family protein [Vibrio cholerae]MCR9746514.1 DUF1441 family protein [Vibrio cholerae]
MGTVTPINDAFAWNITRIAEAFSLHRDTVRKRLKEARVKPVAKRSGVDVYALADVGPALFSAEVGNKSEDDYNPNKMAPKDRKDFFQSERERLKFETEIGELIPDSEYRLDLAAVLKFLVSAFETMPDDLERRYNVPPEVLEHVEQWGDERRAWLYQKLIEVEPDAS